MRRAAGFEECWTIVVSCLQKEVAIVSSLVEGEGARGLRESALFITQEIRYRSCLY